MIVVNDATVKGGTYFPMTVKKHLRAQEIAAQNRPALHLPGRLGRRQPARPGTRCFPTASTSAASSTTRPTCRRAGIPQIAVVMGSCTAGGAYVPAMSDEAIIVEGPGHHLPRRAAAGESGDRRNRHARGTRRRRRAHAPLGSRRPLRAQRPARPAIARRIVGNLNRTKQCRRHGLREPREPLVPVRGDARRHPRRHRASPTTCAR